MSLLDDINKAFDPDMQNNSLALLEDDWAFMSAFLDRALKKAFHSFMPEGKLDALQEFWGDVRRSLDAALREAKRTRTPLTYVGTDLSQKMSMANELDVVNRTTEVAFNVWQFILKMLENDLPDLVKRHLDTAASWAVGVWHLLKSKEQRGDRW